MQKLSNLVTMQFTWRCFCHF